MTKLNFTLKDPCRSCLPLPVCDAVSGQKTRSISGISEKIIEYQNFTCFLDARVLYKFDMASRVGPFDSMHWTPPTGTEMKIIEARRERSDKISKLMGNYLLKGYKMLGITCAICETILLEDRHHTRYCVACNELDSDADKDNPVTNPDAALSQAREQQQPQATEPLNLTPQVQSEFVELPLQPDDPMTETTSPSLQRPVITSTIAIPVTLSPDFAQAVTALVTKLNWATQELNKTTSIEYTIQLCNLIKACSDAISSLQQNQACIQ